MESIYQQMVAAGVAVESHYSDLYVPVNEVTKPLVKASGRGYSIFQHQIHNTLWYDIPFAYDPFWEKVKVPI